MSARASIKPPVEALAALGTTPAAGDSAADRRHPDPSATHGSVGAALLVGLAMVVGGAIAAATLVPMVKGTTGTATPYIPPGGWAAVVGGTVLLAGAATMLPVRRVLRMRPVEAIGIRE